MDRDGLYYKVPCEIFSRVCGFYRPVNQYNPGKKEEFRERKTFKIEFKPAIMRNNL